MPVIGQPAHARAVRTVQRELRALPDGRVRLAKPTSNLFRTHARSGAGLDVSGLTDVIGIDARNRTADVQGMCTYETLVAATLPHGLMPLVVPQLKTITLGGAVTGLGIESSSLFNGLPHESVLEMDVLLGDGEVLRAGPTENDELFRAFPNSYGSLGYALRLRIALQPTAPFVELRHVRFDELATLMSAVESIADKREWDGRGVDFVDGVMFSPGESYLTLATWSDAPLEPVNDYTGRQIFYRSIRQRERDVLTAHDYIWRWDTDWFWCSAAFGAQNPTVRRIWPRRLRRSDVYHRLIGLEAKYDIVGRIERRRGSAPRERVVQDVELPLERTAEFLHWFDREVGMTPVWLCPLRSQQSWPLYPLEPGHTYVNVGFWGTVAIAPGGGDGDVNRRIEAKVAELGGHKSLYSDAYYDRETFDALYGGAAYSAAKARFDPRGRLPGMYEKVIAHR